MGGHAGDVGPRAVLGQREGLGLEQRLTGVRRAQLGAQLARLGDAHRRGRRAAHQRVGDDRGDGGIAAQPGDLGGGDVRGHGVHADELGDVAAAVGRDVVDHAGLRLAGLALAFAALGAADVQGLELVLQAITTAPPWAEPGVTSAGAPGGAASALAAPVRPIPVAVARAVRLVTARNRPRERIRRPL